jgi:short-subunit dehydrogenase
LKPPLLGLAPVLWKEYPYVVTNQTKVLVTGATGFLGNRLATRLVEEGYPIRALARKLSNLSALKKL